MTECFSWLRQIVTVFLVAIALLIIPAFGYSTSFQAHAETLVAAADNYLTDKNDPAIKKAIDMAEDHVGDRDGIGNTGLKNIKKLGENIPETAKEIVRQRFGNDEPADKGAPEVVKDAKR